MNHHKFQASLGYAAISGKPGLQNEILSQSHTNPYICHFRVLLSLLIEFLRPSPGKIVEALAVMACTASDEQD